MEREHRELVRLDRVEPHEMPMRGAAGREVGDAASALGHASYFAELIDEWAPVDSPNERLYRLGAAVSAVLVIVALEVFQRLERVAKRRLNIPSSRRPDPIDSEPEEGD